MIVFIRGLKCSLVWLCNMVVSPVIDAAGSSGSGSYSVFAVQLASIDRQCDGELLSSLVSRDKDGLIFQSAKYAFLSKSCSLLNAAIMLSPP